MTKKIIYYSALIVSIIGVALVAFGIFFNRGEQSGYIPHPDKILPGKPHIPYPPTTQEELIDACVYLVNLAKANLYYSPKATVQTNGYVFPKVGGEQTVKSEKVYTFADSDSKPIMESLSINYGKTVLGINPTVAEKYTYDGSGNITLRRTTVVEPSTLTPNFESEQTTNLTEQQFIDTVGSSPYEIINHHIDKTLIKNVKNYNQGESYTFTLALDAFNSSSSYVKQMKHLSGVDIHQFISADLDITIDQNGYFTSIATTETYSIKQIIVVDCSSVLTQKFFYNT